MMAYKHLVKQLTVDGKNYNYFDLNDLKDERYDRLPISIRYLLESAVRYCDGFHILEKDVQNILDWEKTQYNQTEISFKPARVLLQDFTGVPAVVDLAAMRDAVQAMGGDPGKINPICPVDLVIDHSVQVDYYGDLTALAKNQDIEFERNKERFNFLKWGSKAFKNLSIIPPGSGIVHQVNLEHIARVVFCDNDNNLYVDSNIGTDSHTTQNSGLGILAWGVGGIEAESVKLGQAISMILPEVIGYKLTGKLPQGTTATDLVLTITQNLRALGVVGKFVEFFGDGVANLSIADRATISNMCPEYGATIGLFPVDNRTIKYLIDTGRDLHSVKRAEEYLKANKFFVDYNDRTFNPKYTKVLELDLNTVVSCVSGPKRPHDRVEISKLHSDFKDGLTAKVSFKGYGLTEEDSLKSVTVTINGEECQLKHGSVVISAITSCTNTSNPSVMIGAGLVARKAKILGLKVPPYVKTSLSPGSGVVTKYLEQSGLLPDLQALGYHIAGYGCMTCIGNSGPLGDELTKAIEENDLVVAGVLSGNRNFEGRVHANVRANYLASPMLVVAYGLAGRVDINLETEPLGYGTNGPVYFKDIWPTHDEISEFEQKYIIPQFFKEVYENIEKGGDNWQKLQCPDAQLYPWDLSSTYIKRVPFFDGMTKVPGERDPINNAYALLNLGDSVTTDHISPAGSIARTSPAAKYLNERGVQPRDFNTYGARRGNDEVMVRGTFANIRLVNKLAPKTGPLTTHIKSGEVMSVFDAAERYRKDGDTVIVLAGKDYGCGSSRDWAAKGPLLLGVRAVIAESFERIHRSNLVGMGILPLQYKDGASTESLGLSGQEQFTIDVENLSPGQDVDVKTSTGKSFVVKCRIDTEVELTYYKNGGILNYMVRKLASS